MLKSATFAPMQTASVRTAVSVKLLSFESSGNASRQSCMAVDSPWTESAGNSFTGSFMSKIVTSTHGSPGGCTSSPSTRQRTWPRSVELRVIGSRPFLLRIWRDCRGNRRARIGRTKNSAEMDRARARGTCGCVLERYRARSRRRRSAHGSVSRTKVPRHSSPYATARTRGAGL